MNRLFKISTFLLGVIAIMSLGACSDDIDPEITDLSVSRLFSPVDLKVRIVNQTSARLTWNAVRKASSYDIQVFDNPDEDFSGTPIRDVKGITMAQQPYVITGFDGATTFSVRIKALGDGIGESLWTSTTFTTDAEQILKPLDVENDLTATSVTLKWPAGEIATKVVFEPGNIEHIVTPTEVEAGEATISGLVGETEYTATLMNGEKIRGVVTFKTLLDLGGAIQVNPEDDLVAIIEGASANDVFALMPGEYVVDGNININTTVGIVGARSSDKPTIIGANLRMKSGSGLQLKDLIMNGATAPDGNQAIVYDDDLPAGVYGAVTIENCNISKYVKGIFYVNKVALIESVTFNGNILFDIECAGGDFIDFRAGMTKNFVFKNNTAYNSALARDFFRMDAGGSTNFPAENSIITIENNTFYNVSNTAGKRIAYVRLATHEISFKKNIFAETVALYSNQSTTNVVIFDKNNYFNAPNFLDSEAKVYDVGSSYTTVNPGFANPSKGDFTISHEDLKYDQIGDPRWIK